MHVELSKLPMDSFKDLAKHYLMIVLGILTALGLESWIEHVHHQHAAQAASAQIDAEIRQNRVEIQRMQLHDSERMQSLQKLRDILLNDVKTNASNAAITQHIHDAAPDGIYLDWRWPVLRHEAWDVAVANQSASWIDSEQLHRYASVYAAQSASTAILSEDIPMLIDGPKMIDTTLDLQTDNFQPRELLHVVNQMVWVTSEVTHNLENLANRVDAAMPGIAPASAISTAAH
jgi:hypothetical protein